MKAIGRNLIIQKLKEGTTVTKGGLMLSENQREDIRYVEASVLSIGDEVVGVKENDKIFFDVIHRYPNSSNDVSFQYEEKIIDGKFVSKLNKTDENRLNLKIGHSEIVIDR